jgi:hypothetical protein
METNSTTKKRPRIAARCMAFIATAVLPWIIVWIEIKYFPNYYNLIDLSLCGGIAISILALMLASACTRNEIEEESLEFDD